MSDPDDDERVLSLVLDAVPERFVRAAIGEGGAAVVAHTREALHRAMLDAIEPVAPSASLRERVAAAIDARPRPSKRCLLVLDMINDYLTPGRALFVPRAFAILDRVRERIERARREGTPVIFACDRHEPDDPDLEQFPEHCASDGDGWRPHPTLGARESDALVGHRTYSAFFQSELESVIEALGARSLVLVGCATDVGLIATATDAMMRGYAVEVPPDCQAGTSEVAEKHALETLRLLRPLPAR